MAVKGKDIRNKNTDGMKIILDKERHILFDLNAFCDLEEEFGSIDEAFKMLGNGSMKGMRRLLYFGLQHEDEELTEYQVGKMINMNNINTLADTLGKAMSGGLPEVDEDDIPLPSFPNTEKN